MKEVFYNFLIFICFCNISILQSNFINSKYINLNSVPYQEAKISFGLGLINNNTTNFSLSFQNWFTDNLYCKGLLSPIKNDNDLFLSYSLNLGYGYNIEKEFIKTLIINIGYNRLRYSIENNQNKNISIGYLIMINTKNIWFSIGYNFIDEKIKNIQQFSFDILKNIHNKYILQFGLKYDFDNSNNNLTSHYFIFNYSI